MRRLYYIAEDIRTTEAISEALHDAGITNWNFHVLAKDDGGLYRHHIHSANTLQKLDIIHTGERWAMVGALIGLAAGLTLLLTNALPWASSPLLPVLFTLIGGGFGAWQGGMVGLTRENYKVEAFHDDIEARRYLVMVDVGDDKRAFVREIMNMRFPEVRYGGGDSTFINPFKRPARIYHQTTH